MARLTGPERARRPRVVVPVVPVPRQLNGRDQVPHDR